MTSHSHDTIFQKPDIQPIHDVYIFGVEDTPSIESIADSSVTDTLHEMSPGELLVMERHASRLGEIATASLRQAPPELGAGRSRSQNAVQFGQLALVDNDNPPAVDLVAVKYVPAETAAREFEANRYVNAQLGRRAAFETLGFIKPDTDSDHIGLLSRYEHRVTSLDNTLFNQNSSSKERTRAAKIAGKYLATLHGETIGLTHGDAQAKNIALIPGKGLRFIDLEAAFDVTANYHGDTVPHPELNKLTDISAFFAMPDEAQDWKPTLEEMMAFMETYVQHQTGENRLDEADIFDLTASKLF